MLDVGTGRGIVGRQMSEKNDGGFAFSRPSTRIEHANGDVEWFDGHGGMSLRDWFAGQIVGHCLANPNQNPEFVRDVSAADQATVYAENAYLLADAMLIARAKP